MSRLDQAVQIEGLIASEKDAAKPCPDLLGYLRGLLECLDKGGTLTADDVYWVTRWSNGDTSEPSPSSER